MVALRSPQEGFKLQDQRALLNRGASNDHVSSLPGFQPPEVIWGHCSLIFPNKFVCVLL